MAIRPTSRAKRSLSFRSRRRSSLSERITQELVYRKQSTVGRHPAPGNGAAVGIDRPRIIGDLANEGRSSRCDGRVRERPADSDKRGQRQRRLKRIIWLGRDNFAGSRHLRGVSVTDAEPTAAPRFRPPPAPTIARPTRLGKLTVFGVPPNVLLRTIARGIAGEGNRLTVCAESVCWRKPLAKS